MPSTKEEHLPDNDHLRPRRRPASLLFRLVVPVTFLFVFTCFLIITHDLVGDQNSTFAGILREHGTRVLAWEAAIAVLVAVVAMAVDRMKTLRSTSQSGDEAPAAAASGQASKPEGARDDSEG